MNILIEKTIICPYCSESIVLLIDRTDIGTTYIEDCAVCCKPISLVISETRDGQLHSAAYSEDDVY